MTWRSSCCAPHKFRVKGGFDVFLGRKGGIFVPGDVGAAEGNKGGHKEFEILKPLGARNWGWVPQSLLGLETGSQSLLELGIQGFPKPCLGWGPQNLPRLGTGDGEPGSTLCWNLWTSYPATVGN